MKKIRKILLFVCVLTCIFALTACGKTEKEKASFDFTESDLVSCVTTNTETAAGWDDKTLDEAIDSYDEKDEKEANLKKGLEQFKAAREEAGEFVGFYLDDKGNAKYKLTQDTDSVTITLKSQFKDRDVKVTYVFGLIDKEVSITSMTYEPQYSVLEKMEKAALNTVMGMCTVIIVLFFLCILIAQFVHVKKIETFFAGISDKRKNKKNGKKDSADAVDNVIEQIVEKEKLDEADDTELAAVITAAIAASEMTSTDGFVVRSIKRVNNRNWK